MPWRRLQIIIYSYLLYRMRTVLTRTCRRLPLHFRTDGCRYTSEPCTYHQKLNGLRLALFKTSLTDSLQWIVRWYLPSKSIQHDYIFPHLTGVHFFIFYDGTIFFFLKKSDPPGYQMGGPLTRCDTHTETLLLFGHGYWNSIYNSCNMRITYS